MKKQCYQLLILSLLGMLMYSCQNEDDFDHVNDANNSQEVLSQVKFGKDLNIPYTNENMSKAFDQVLAHFDAKKPYGKSKFALKSDFSLQSKSAKSIEIMPSHYYYRFLPKDSLEYETLVNDTMCYQYTLT